MRLSLEQLKALPFVELKALWKEYVSALAVALVEADEQEACPAGQRAIQLMGELRFVLSCLMADNPNNAHYLRHAPSILSGWRAELCAALMCLGPVCLCLCMC